MSCPSSVLKKKGRQGKEGTQSQVCWDVVLDVLLSDQSFQWAGTDTGYCDLHLPFSSSSLLDACEPPKINYSACGFCCAFLLPKTDFLFESNSSALVGRKCSYLFPQLIPAVTSWWRLKDTFESGLPLTRY